MRALILVDLQNDFMPFGSLPVKRGDESVDVANRLMPAFELVAATQDWHPTDHGSFASNHPGHVPGDVVELAGLEQVLWPDHCVQNSPGASFHSSLDVAGIDHVVHKGTNRLVDSYSTFFDNAHGVDTGLNAYLREHGVDEIVLVGLATDYCVLFSALDARELGYRVLVASDGVRAVDLKPTDGQLALDAMAAAGAEITSSEAVVE